MVSPEFPGGDNGETYYYAATCRQQLQRWDDAIKYFQKVVDDYPDFEEVGTAQAAVGWCYEALLSTKQVPREAVEPLIERAYITVVTDYPNCSVADYAAYRMGEISLEKGDEANAVIYYRKFLQIARPDDGRTVRVNTMLKKLEGNNK